MALQTDEARSEEMCGQTRLTHHGLVVQQHADAIIVHGDLERVPVSLRESRTHGLRCPAGRGSETINCAGFMQTAAVDRLRVACGIKILSGLVDLDLDAVPIYLVEAAVTDLGRTLTALGPCEVVPIRSHPPGRLRGRPSQP